MQLGLVTYMWGADWDLPTLIKNCQQTGFAGVELRTTHKHGVEPTLSPDERKDVAKRFADSGVELVGLGTACEYHSPDPAVLKKNIEETKAFIKLCHDCGGTGVKVRPNGLPKEVPVQKTLEQIGRALGELAAFGEGYGVVIRLEVHGSGTDRLPNVKTIMDAAQHKGATVCWNCNDDRHGRQGTGTQLQPGEEPAGHDPHPRPDQQLSLAAVVRAAQGREVRRLDAFGRRRSHAAIPIRVMKYYRLLWERMTA